MSDNKLIIFVKAPVAGKVKTRLVPPLTSEQSAELYKNWAREIYLSISALDSVAVEIAYDPHPDFPTPQWLKQSCSTPKEIIITYKSLLPLREKVRMRGEDSQSTGEGANEKYGVNDNNGLVGYFLQEGNNLGERLIHAFNRAFQNGTKHVVIIGSDSPGLPLDYIIEAFHALKSIDFVTGPTQDGGYYLIGLRNRVDPELFSNVEWSTEKVFSKTLENSKTLELSVHLLPEYFDIDTADDLKYLDDAKVRDVIPDIVK